MGDAGSKPGKKTLKLSDSDFGIEPSVDALPDCLMSSSACVEIRDQTGAMAQVLPELGGGSSDTRDPSPGMASWKLSITTTQS